MGLFDKTKKQTTTNNVYTTTDIETGDIGLTGAAAVDLANVSIRPGVEAITAATYNQKLNTEFLGNYVDESNITTREIAGQVAKTHELNVGFLTSANQENSANYTQFLGGANNLLDSSERQATVTLDYASKSADAIQSGAKNVLDSARNISDRLLPQTKELQNIAIGALVLTGVIFVANAFKKR